MKEHDTVRSRKDGATGVVRATHQDLPQDPMQFRVHWHDGIVSWHEAWTLELVCEGEPEPSEKDLMATTVTQNLGISLARLRAERGISQHALAEKIGLSRSYLASIETGVGELPLKTFVRLCLLWNLQPNQLLPLELEGVPEEAPAPALKLGPAHKKRGGGGKFVKGPVCAVCAKPTGVDPGTDSDIPGKFLCKRKTCARQLEGLDVEGRRALYAKVGH